MECLRIIYYPGATVPPCTRGLNLNIYLLASRFISRVPLLYGCGWFECARILRYHAAKLSSKNLEQLLLIHLECNAQRMPRGNSSDAADYDDDDVAHPHDSCRSRWSFFPQAPNRIPS